MPAPLWTDDAVRIISEGDVLWIGFDVGDDLDIIEIGKDELFAFLHHPIAEPAPEIDQPNLGMPIDAPIAFHLQHLKRSPDQLERGAGYGNTLTWTDHDKPKVEVRPVEVQVDLDKEKFYKMFVGLLTSPTPQSQLGKH